MESKSKHKPDELLMDAFGFDEDDLAATGQASSVPSSGQILNVPIAMHGTPTFTEHLRPFSLQP